MPRLHVTRLRRLDDGGAAGGGPAPAGARLPLRRPRCRPGGLPGYPRLPASRSPCSRRRTRRRSRTCWPPCTASPPSGLPRPARRAGRLARPPSLTPNGPVGGRGSPADPPRQVRPAGPPGRASASHPRARRSVSRARACLPVETAGPRPWPGRVRVPAAATPPCPLDRRGLCLNAPDDPHAVTPPFARSPALGHRSPRGPGQPGAGREGGGHGAARA
jgi:hypothetical protein